MEIVAGTARGITLYSPPENEAVRPTSVRARRAFFDALGNCTDIIFADIFAGSGAMGLEAASRGARKVYFFEQSPSVLKIIESNCMKLKKAGVSCEFKIVRGTVPPFHSSIAKMDPPDIIFADPPYPQSMEFLDGITSDPRFRIWAENAVMYWEMPERNAGLNIPPKPWKIEQIRNCGSARFLELRCVKE